MGADNKFVTGSDDSRDLFHFPGPPNFIKHRSRTKA